MNEIKQTTIDKYVKFLNAMKEHEGHEFEIEKAVRFYGINNAAPYYARDLGLLQFNGKKIQKVNFTKAEPILARRLIKYVSTKSQESRDKRLGVVKTATIDQYKNEVEEYGTKIHAEIAQKLCQAPTETTQPMLGAVAVTPQEQRLSKKQKTENVMVNPINSDTKFVQIKIFGLPIFEIKRNK